jgi:hypothetical protein
VNSAAKLTDNQTTESSTRLVQRVAREPIRSGLVELPESHSPVYVWPAQLAYLLVAL